MRIVNYKRFVISMTVAMILIATLLGFVMFKIDPPNNTTDMLKITDIQTSEDGIQYTFEDGSGYWHEFK